MLLWRLSMLLLLLLFVPAEGQLRSIAQGLCNFNGKQLQAVGHLLSDEHIKQIKIGMDIPPTNQVLQLGAVIHLQTHLSTLTTCDPQVHALHLEMYDFTAAARYQPYKQHPGQYI